MNGVHETRQTEQTEHVETVVVGAGQAGLAAGYHLAHRRREFVILDAGRRVGDNWRCHWDSLRLYSPAYTATLPGMRLPAPRMSFPSKDEMADFLETYAARFALPVRTGVRVRRVSRQGDRYTVTTDTGTLTCDNVVVASGTFGRTPYVPDFAPSLAPGIAQMHSSAYKNPSQLVPGGVLVVGASHSGGDIAFEAASAGHPTVLSGRTHQVPFDIEGRAAGAIFPVLLFLARHVMTVRTPLGRKMRPQVRAHGGPLIRHRRADLEGAGVDMASERTVGVTAEGLPVLDGGRVLDVANVVWCTGFRQDFSWIDLPVTGDDGWPRERRGVVESAPGLYFTGLAFQYAFASTLVAGAGRDAEHVVRHLVARTPGRQPRRSVRLSQAPEPSRNAAPTR